MNRSLLFYLFLVSKGVITKNDKTLKQRDKVLNGGKDAGEALKNACIYTVENKSSIKPCNARNQKDVINHK